jgi:hypothetical protein
MIELVPIGMLVAVLGWWLWVDYQNRLARKEWRDHPIDEEQDFAEQDRRLEEMEQKIRQLQAELAALKHPAA